MVSPDAAREFSITIVRRLREAGHEALWAGGCVRDRLLGRIPKDYDIATSATPEQIRQLLGHQRTLAIGQAFGVITVIGPSAAGNMEIATFRSDGDYTDGRHPDKVTFTSAREDALRRDFTINGLFYDPLAEEISDYVGGQEDLKKGIIRAIGSPHQRIAEDKLRMLRAVRFAATLGFELETATAQAVSQHAHQIGVVSAERIAAELRRMLAGAGRSIATEMLIETGLLVEILPEAGELLADTTRKNELLQIVGNLPDSASYTLCLAAWLRAAMGIKTTKKQLQAVCRRWKLSSDEMQQVSWLVTQLPIVLTGDAGSWPRLQRVLIQSGIDDLLQFAGAVERVATGNDKHTAECRQHLTRPEAEWNPAALINGNDLIAMNIPRGRIFHDVLEAVRDAQLLDEIHDKPAALQRAEALYKASES
jgi:tRNA nucleotidyltransferase/poly(A) polymerase